jgi:hypothetical protein
MRTSLAERRVESARKPDFFIIGAPKSGTTSLYTYLAAHPQIFMPGIKEPFFFCADLPGYREQETLVTTMKGYLQFFAAATETHIACGEASVFYLFSKVAVPRILELNPNARFIVMLRNPVDLVYSFHSQLVYSLRESVIDFEQAWRLQDVRAQGRCIPEHCLERALLQYRQVGMLGEQVSRLFTHVCRSQVKFLLMDDLIKDPQGMYEAVLTFLGVPGDHRSEFPKMNANKTHRVRFLTEFIRYPPFPLNILRDFYRRHVGVGTWPSQMFSRLNEKVFTRKPLSSEMRLELEAEFYEDARLLECLINRDLSHWISTTRSPARLGQQAA